MYNGWLMFAGTEVLNAPRTVAYAETMLPGTKLTDCTDCDVLAAAIDDAPYSTPSADAAPWYDPEVPQSANFLGFYPLELQGFTKSTRTGTANESTHDGGYVSGVRSETREMRVRGLLIGTNVEAAEVGMSWLKNVVQGSACADCEGDDLCFMTSCPTVGQYDSEAVMDAAVTRVLRHVRDVTCISGPEPINEYNLRSGGHMIEVEVTFVAGTPHLYSDPISVAKAEGTTLTAVDPTASIFSVSTLPACAFEPTVLPLLDPDCPVVPDPPYVPALGTQFCAPEPATFFSYAIHIPASMLHAWNDAVPTLTITTGEQAVRHVRIRFLPRIPETANVANLDPCSACSSFIIHYIPGSTVAVVDGMTERVSMQRSNASAQAAEHLLTGVGTDVFEWPVLSCGIGYYCLVDVDVNSIIGLELSISHRE